MLIPNFPRFSNLIRSNTLCRGICIIVVATLVAIMPSFAGEIDAVKNKCQKMGTTETHDIFWNETETGLNESEKKRQAVANCPVTSDMFEMKPDAEIWNLDKMKPVSRFKIRDEHFRDGSHSLAILLDKNDPPTNKKKTLHKHELRIANHRRCNFGDETWYSFSFRIEGKYPLEGSTRWVIGQWKEDTCMSPFLAQRYDNGVFHITIQSNDTRMLIACAPGNPNRFELAGKDSTAAGTTNTKPNPCHDIGQLQVNNTSGTLDYQPLIEAIRNQQIDLFPFVADPDTYRNSKQVIIEPSETPILPNPGDGWVDMRYRIRGGRNGNGIIEVWANDIPIVTVTGKIGNDIFTGPTQYFKVGHYRDIDEEFEDSTLYFDRFKRGTTRNQVD